mgnify:CR=1 FL=1
MKNTTIITLAAMLFGSAGAFADSAVTKPAGFVTHTLKSGQFNLIGLTLHQPVTVAGAFSAVASNDNGTGGDTDDDYSVLTDANVDFNTALTSGKTYILEITDAANTALNGTIQEVTVWSGATVTTPNDIVADGVAIGDKYQIREAVTIQQIFGTPPAIKSTASAASSDVIWVADGSGGYTQYYYKTPIVGSPSWFNATTNSAVVGDIPIVYTDAVIVQIQSGSPDVNLVVTGSVKTGEVALAVFTGFNLVSNVYPVGSTLQNSDLSSSLTSTASASSSDVIWMPNGLGGYDRYYYKTPIVGSPSWFNATSNSAVVSDVILTSAFFIQRIGSATNVDIDPPTSYNNL